MIDNIKSSYFVKILFSFIDEERKLKIVNYNKYLNKLLHIYIMNYRILSKRYIEYEANGKAKEFDGFYDSIIFEGDYLNGKRNGKGKEFDEFNGKIIFEGEYLNGKRNGKGKELYGKDNLIFEGEYLNG